MARTMMVLPKEATIMGQKETLITSRYSIMATPGGTKKKGRFFTRKSDIPFTQCGFTHPSFKNRVNSNNPIMLAGSLIPVKLTIISPIAKHPKIITHCLIII